MLLVCHTSAYRKVAARLRGGMLLLAALPDALSAQHFEHVASLYFTRPFGAPDLLPQVLAIAITGANFGFTSRPLPLRHPARFRRHAPGPVAARHATSCYLTSPGGAEGVPFLSTASSVFSDYGNSTDHGVCADAVLSVPIGNIELN